MPGIPVPPPSNDPSRALASIVIAGHAKRAGFSPAEVPVAVAIAMAESGGVANATHRNSDGSTDYGLWQINSSHKAEFDMSRWADPGANAVMAYKVYKMQGWKAWATYTSGRYKDFTETGKDAGDVANRTPVGGLLPDFSSIGASITKVGSSVASVVIAVVLLTLGVVILMRTTVVGAAAGGALKAVQKVAK